jgi:hypothetical protein
MESHNIGVENFCRTESGSEKNCQKQGEDAKIDLLRHT